MHGVGSGKDHIHVVFSLPPKFKISEFIGKLKGASSHFVTHVCRSPEHFEWQNEYGIVTFGDNAMRNVLAYVNNQTKHHQDGTINQKMEVWGGENDL